MAEQPKPTPTKKKVLVKKKTGLKPKGRKKTAASANVGPEDEDDQDEFEEVEEVSEISVAQAEKEGSGSKPTKKNPSIKTAASKAPGKRKTVRIGNADDRWYGQENQWVAITLVFGIIGIVAAAIVVGVIYATGRSSGNSTRPPPPGPGHGPPGVDDGQGKQPDIYPPPCQRPRPPYPLQGPAVGQHCNSCRYPEPNHVEGCKNCCKFYFGNVDKRYEDCSKECKK